ncbi:RelA/SpoT domain-containing protein [Apiospora arundinis]|uniref:RelA/SpoT domain-containing protein n=1 Tax=Apiospora arundinis TaxID=335852 RepID=A0ABR2JI01_9PEZI
MSDSSELFSTLLKEFEKTYNNEKTLVGHHVAKLLRILEDDTIGLDARQILHIPITSRIKSLSSAVGSLKRRLKDRCYHAELKAHLERHDRSWSEYWTKWGQEYRIDEIGPFRNLKEMYKTLHDIGGIRICVYFPGDVEKVVAFLKGRSDIEVKRVMLRGQEDAAPDIRELEQYLAYKDNDASQLKKWRERIKRPPNYRATHVIVKLKGSSNEPQDNPIVVEIQIATVVMHAWSQIEHDIVYKPNSETPKEEQLVLEGILDTFNSVAKSGESALAQMENYRHFMAERRSANDLNPADNAFEFGVFLFNTCKAKSLSPFEDPSSGTSNWSYLDQLFKVLRATNEHNMRKLQELLESFINRNKQNAQSIGCDLPLHLLREIYDRDIDDVEAAKRVNPPMSEQESDRASAIKAVNCFNIASYLGIEEAFIAAIDESLPPEDERPSLIDMLDFVHPHHPRLNHLKWKQITNFCNAILDGKRLKQSASEKHGLSIAVLELPILLSEIGYSVLQVEPNASQAEGSFIFPGSLSKFLPDDNGTHLIPQLLQISRAIHGVRMLLDWSHGKSLDNAEDTVERRADYEVIPRSHPLEGHVSINVNQSEYDLGDSLASKWSMIWSMLGGTANTAPGSEGTQSPYQKAFSLLIPWAAEGLHDTTLKDSLNTILQSLKYEYEFGTSGHRSSHFGYFKPGEPIPEDESPPWAYVEGRRRQLQEAKLVRTNPQTQSPQPDIVVDESVNDGFQQLVKAVKRMEPGCQLKHMSKSYGKDGSPVNEFCLTIGKDKFCLLLSQKKFTLKLSKDGAVESNGKRALDENVENFASQHSGRPNEGASKRRKLSNGTSSAGRSE